MFEHVGFAIEHDNRKDFRGIEFGSFLDPAVEMGDDALGAVAIEDIGEFLLHLKGIIEDLIEHVHAVNGHGFPFEIRQRKGSGRDELLKLYTHRNTK